MYPVGDADQFDDDEIVNMQTNEKVSIKYVISPVSPITTSQTNCTCFMISQPQSYYAHNLWKK